MKSPRAFLSALCLLAAPALAEPDPAEAEIIRLNQTWAEIFYLPADNPVQQYQALLARIRALKAGHPERAEPLILEAITLCTLAAADWGFDSLSRINEAKELLEKSIDLDPKAMEGTALITLGNLYYRLPGWPISFGDDDLARQYLEMAAKLFPDTLDANYFLGDYWLREEEYDKALPYLEKADKAPARPYHRFSDSQVKKEARKALQAARNRDDNRDDFFGGKSPDFGD